MGMNHDLALSVTSALRDVSPFYFVLGGLALAVVIVGLFIGVALRRSRVRYRREVSIGLPELGEVPESWGDIARYADLPFLSSLLAQHPRSARTEKKVESALPRGADPGTWTDFIIGQGPLLAAWYDAGTRADLITRATGRTVSDTYLWGYVADTRTARVGVVLGETWTINGVTALDLIACREPLGALIGTQHLDIDHAAPGVVVVSWPLFLPDPPIHLPVPDAAEEYLDPEPATTEEYAAPWVPEDDLDTVAATGGEDPAEG